MCVCSVSEEKEQVTVRELVIAEPKVNRYLQYQQLKAVFPCPKPQGHWQGQRKV